MLYKKLIFLCFLIKINTCLRILFNYGYQYNNLQPYYNQLNNYNQRQYYNFNNHNNHCNNCNHYNNAINPVKYEPIKLIPLPEGIANMNKLDFEFKSFDFNKSLVAKNKNAKIVDINENNQSDTEKNQNESKIEDKNESDSEKNQNGSQIVDKNENNQSNQKELPDTKNESNKQNIRDKSNNYLYIIPWLVIIYLMIMIIIITIWVIKNKNKKKIEEDNL